MKYQTLKGIDASFEDVVFKLVGKEAPQKKEITKPGLKSPLRYPGGKSRAVKELIKFFPEGLDRVCSPFLGGGSIELELANRGAEVFAYDVFEPLVDFWQALLDNPKQLADAVRKYYPITNSKFYSLQKECLNIQDKKERAAVFFVLNRASFSGTTLSGGMSPGHPRFTDSIIEYLEKFTISNLHVEKADFTVSLAKHPTDFLYLDPPYANGEKLYGDKGSTHEYFDHTALAEILKQRDGWILSYNDSQKVRDWYKGYEILMPKWTYGMNKDKKPNELLILSKDFIKL